MTLRRFVATGLALAMAALLVSGPAMAAGKPAPTAKVNINTASVEQLTTLPGVGPKLAARIVEYRQKSGHVPLHAGADQREGHRREELRQDRGLAERRRGPEGGREVGRSGAARPSRAAPRFGEHPCATTASRSSRPSWSSRSSS